MNHLLFTKNLKEKIDALTRFDNFLSGALRRICAHKVVKSIEEFSIQICAYKI